MLGLDDLQLRRLRSDLSVVDKIIHYNVLPVNDCFSFYLNNNQANNRYKLKDEFLDVIYWFRQIIAVILGVIWGIVPLKGFVGIAIFCLINAGVLYLYFSSFQQIDEEEYGGTWELTKVVWIIFYTAIHYD